MFSKIVFRDRMNVEIRAMNQQVEPFFPIYLASRPRMPSFDNIEMLSKNQYKPKNILVIDSSTKSYVFILFFLPNTYSSFPYSLKVLNNRNSLRASLIAQKRASTFFYITLSPFLL